VADAAVVDVLVAVLASYADLGLLDEPERFASAPTEKANVAIMATAINRADAFLKYVLSINFDLLE